LRELQWRGSLKIAHSRTRWNNPAGGQGASEGCEPQLTESAESLRTSKGRLPSEISMAPNKGRGDISAAVDIPS